MSMSIHHRFVVRLFNTWRHIDVIFELLNAFAHTIWMRRWPEMKLDCT